MPASKIFLVAFQPNADAGSREADLLTLERAVTAAGGARVRAGEYLLPSAELADIDAASTHCRELPRAGEGAAGTVADRRGDRLIVEEVTHRGSIAVHADDPQGVLAWLSDRLGPETANVPAPGDAPGPAAA